MKRNGRKREKRETEKIKVLIIFFPSLKHRKRSNTRLYSIYTILGTKERTKGTHILRSSKQEELDDERLLAFPFCASFCLCLLFGLIGAVYETTEALEEEFCVKGAHVC